MAELPPFAAWQHHDARVGFEVAYFRVSPDGIVIDGTTTAVEAGEPWCVTYRIELSTAWVTRRAVVGNRTGTGTKRVTLTHDGAGEWTVDGAPAPQLTGCLEVDLEASALTNAFPVHRLALAPGATADAPAAYVRALDLSTGRLAQTYRRVDDDEIEQRFAYAAPEFAFTAELHYDEAGLVLEYPGLATRAA